MRGEHQSSWQMVFNDVRVDQQQKVAAQLLEPYFLKILPRNSKVYFSHIPFFKIVSVLPSSSDTPSARQPRCVRNVQVVAGSRKLHQPCALMALHQTKAAYCTYQLNLESCLYILVNICFLKIIVFFMSLPPSLQAVCCNRCAATVLRASA